jgi:uncharacterized repeat protein (TIGR03803 family)
MGKLNWGMRACGIFLLWATTALALPAQTFTTLHSFGGADGDSPVSALVQGTNGNLYGTTLFGGANARCAASTCGTAFKITTSGRLTILYNFCSQGGFQCTDGANPQAAVIQATNGNLYGTTFYGGAKGYGTIFKITPGGALTILHNFKGTNSARPYAGLVQAADGNLFGTTTAGGADNAGTVFTITPNGTLTKLHGFDVTDGASPYAGLVQATDGDFYGTTLGGGAFGSGAVFKITPKGKLDTLYSFCSQSGCPDGHVLYAGLVQASNGNFYGATFEGGVNGYGTIFTITPGGALTTLYSFDDTDGAFPYSGLVQATDGNLYGTTSAGGANGNGTVFQITLGGTLTTLHSFEGKDGFNPEGALVQDTNGKFYGTTAYGGKFAFGTVFSLSLGLGPFVETMPASGRVGAAVKILGTGLTGATSVTFNGVPATFTVLSGSEITTTVPAATSGTVQVVTPGATLLSNVPFQVKP